MDILKELHSRWSLGKALVRSTVFTGEKLALPLIEKLATGTVSGKNPLEDPVLFRKALEEVYQLLKKDGENIARGFYPREVLKAEGILEHFRRVPKIILDGYFISRRRKNKNHRDFSKEAQSYFADVPEYFQRNFHFQSDGYLTKKSAELYEHQVEILFSGAADAMRRLVIPLLKAKYPGDGEGLRFLELGAGTGRLTKFMSLAFPKAKIIATDVSSPYLQKARENLKDFSRVDFLQAMAEEIPLPDGSFDVVYSCFLFHELPLEIRKRVLTESFRLLKAGGFFGFVDSIQKKDAEHFQWALARFPVDFHEPFYKNYIEHDMAELLTMAKYDSVQTERGFFSKAMLAEKPVPRGKTNLKSAPRRS